MNVYDFFDAVAYGNTEFTCNKHNCKFTLTLIDFNEGHPQVFGECAVEKGNALKDFSELSDRPRKFAQLDLVCYEKGTLDERVRHTFYSTDDMAFRDVIFKTYSTIYDCEWEEL